MFRPGRAPARHANTNIKQVYMCSCAAISARWRTVAIRGRARRDGRQASSIAARGLSQRRRLTRSSRRKRCRSTRNIPRRKKTQRALRAKRSPKTQRAPVKKLRRGMPRRNTRNQKYNNETLNTPNTARRRLPRRQQKTKKKPSCPGRRSVVVVCHMF